MHVLTLKKEREGGARKGGGGREGGRDRERGREGEREGVAGAGGGGGGGEGDVWRKTDASLIAAFGSAEERRGEMEGRRGER